MAEWYVVGTHGQPPFNALTYWPGAGETGWGVVTSHCFLGFNDDVLWLPPEVWRGLLPPLDQIAPAPQPDVTIPWELAERLLQNYVGAGPDLRAAMDATVGVADPPEAPKEER